MNSTIVSKVPVNTRYLTSLLSFGCKGICAVAINYWLANSLRVDDFALWATIFSLGMILSVGDFGVGQLVLTSIHENNLAESGDNSLLTNSVAAMAILSTLILLLTFLFLTFYHVPYDIKWIISIVLLILFRLIVIPYGAVLSAINRYHERKFIEAVNYAICALFILLSIKLKADVFTMLLGMNFLLTLGSLAIGVRAARVGGLRFEIARIQYCNIKKIFSDSLPYFINNVSGLAIYGGFIFFSSLILNSTEIAKLSLLHNLIFMHLYQVFELIFRTSQTKLQDQSLMKKLKILVIISYLGCLISAALSGVLLFKFFFGKYEYTANELLIYTTFAFLEIYYLLLTSKMQMKSTMRQRLQSMSLIKTLVFIGILIFVSEIRANPSLVLYSSFLVIYSLFMAYWAHTYAEEKGSINYLAAGAD